MIPVVTKEQHDAANMAELARLPSSANASALLEDALAQTLAFEAEHHPRKQKWREADLKRFRRSMGALLGDLIAHAANEKAGGLMYRSTRRDAFQETHCSSRHYERLERLWKEMGWIEVYQGFQKWGDFDGSPVKDFARARRLRATQALLAVAARYEITPEDASKHFSKDRGKGSPIEVKTRSVKGKNGKKRSKMMKPVQCPRLDYVTDQMRQINRFLEDHRFNLEDTPQFKRTFHNGDDADFDYNQGGRLYCVTRDNYQSKPKAERLEITINGERCAEVDISNSFPSICQWLNDLPVTAGKDFYQIDGIERVVVKKIVVARLGSDDWPRRWPKGFKDEYFQETGRKLEKRHKLKDVVEAVRSKIPMLDEIDQTRNGWAQLQYFESEAVLGAIMDLNNQGIVALPIHDSLVIAERHAETAKQALKESFLSSFGFTPDVKVISRDGL